MSSHREQRALRHLLLTQQDPYSTSALESLPKDLRADALRAVYLANNSRDLFWAVEQGRQVGIADKVLAEMILERLESYYRPLHQRECVESFFSRTTVNHLWDVMDDAQLVRAIRRTIAMDPSYVLELFFPVDGRLAHDLETQKMLLRELLQKSDWQNISAYRLDRGISILCRLPQAILGFTEQASVLRKLPMLPAQSYYKEDCNRWWHENVSPLRLLLAAVGQCGNHTEEAQKLFNDVMPIFDNVDPVLLCRTASRYDSTFAKTAFATFLQRVVQEGYVVGRTETGTARVKDQSYCHASTGKEPVGWLDGRLIAINPSETTAQQGNSMSAPFIPLEWSPLDVEWWKKAY